MRNNLVFGNISETKPEIVEDAESVLRNFGTVIYYRDYVKPGITVVRNHYDTVIWLRLSHDFFGFDRDVYICGMYIWG